MSNTVNKQALLEWISSEFEEISWGAPARFALRHVKREIESGRFDSNPKELGEEKV